MSRHLPGGVLIKRDIEKLMEEDPPLVENLCDPVTQVQEHGVDITVESVHRFESDGRIGFDNEQRRLAVVEEVPFAAGSPVSLSPGPYLVQFREILHLPLYIAAVGWPRSSLIRSGVTLDCAIWDAGFSGRSASLMVVHNPYGFELLPGARVLQLMFLATSDSVKHGYRGVFSNRIAPDCR